MLIYFLQFCIVVLAYIHYVDNWLKSDVLTRVRLKFGNISKLVNFYLSSVQNQQHGYCKNIIKENQSRTDNKNNIYNCHYGGITIQNKKRSCGWGEYSLLTTMIMAPNWSCLINR